jgi:hypothetical protein
MCLTGMAFLVLAALAQVLGTVALLRLNATRIGAFWGRDVWLIEESGYRVGVREKIRVVDTPHEVVVGVLGAILFGLSGLWPFVGIGWQLSVDPPLPVVLGVGGVLAGAGLLSMCGSAVLVLRGHAGGTRIAQALGILGVLVGGLVLMVVLSGRSRPFWLGHIDELSIPGIGLSGVLAGTCLLLSSQKAQAVAQEREP